MAPNFSVIAIHWLLTFDSEMAILLFHSLAQGVLVFFFLNSCGSRKMHCQTGAIQSKFHSKNRYRIHHFVIHAISFFGVKFTMDLTSQAMNFSIKESKENDLIKQQPETLKRGQLKTFYFH